MPFQNDGHDIIWSMGMEKPTVQAKKSRMSQALRRFIWFCQTGMARGTRQKLMPATKAPRRCDPIRLATYE